MIQAGFIERALTARSCIRVAVVAAIGLGLSACSSVHPLDRLAKRISLNEKSAENDVSLDTSSRETVAQMKKLAWASFTVSFECPKQCPYAEAERAQLAQEIAESGFVAFDREIRKALGTSRDLLEASDTVSQPAFSKEIAQRSFKTTVSRWLSRLGLSQSQDVTATAEGLKSINPNELGWSGGESLGELGRGLGVDGVLVGHIQVTPDLDSGSERKLVINGPKIWLFSSKSSNAVAVAGLRPSWRPNWRESTAETIAATSITPTRFDASQELRRGQLDLKGMNDLASGFGVRISKALQQSY